MKYNILLIFVIVIAILHSCNSQTKSNEDIGYSQSELFKYEEACDVSAKSKVIIDEIFLGLKFGMTENEVNDHLREMMNEGKLYVNDFGGLQYTLTIDNNSSLKATLSSDYFNGILYKFSLIFQEYNTGRTSVPVNKEFMTNKAKSLFLKKYKIDKDNFTGYYYTSQELGTFSCFINKNMIIEFNPLGSMSYINAPIQQKKEQEKVNKTISDL